MFILFLYTKGELSSFIYFSVPCLFHLLLPSRQSIWDELLVCGNWELLASHQPHSGSECAGSLLSMGCLQAPCCPWVANFSLGECWLLGLVWWWCCPVPSRSSCEASSVSVSSGRGRLSIVDVCVPHRGGPGLCHVRANPSAQRATGRSERAGVSPHRWEASCR